MDQYKQRQRFHILAAASAGLFAGGLFQYLTFAARRMGASVSMVALLTALPRVAMLTAFLYAHWFDHVPSNRRMATPRIIGALVLMLLTLTTDPFWFVFVGIVGSFFLLVSQTFYGSLLADLYPSTHRGRFLVMPMVAWMVTVMMSNAAAGRLLDLHPGNYRFVFFACALAGVGAGFLFMKIPIAPSSAPCEPVTKMKDLFHVFRDKPFLTWTVIYSITAFPYWLAVPALPIFFNDELMFSYATFGVTQIVFNGAMLLAFLGAGRLVDRWGSPAVMALAWSGIALGLLMLGRCNTLGIVLLAQALHGAGMGLNDMAWYPVILEFAPRDKVSRYMGTYITFCGLRALIGSWLGGVLINSFAGDSRIVLMIAGIAILPGCLLIALSLRWLNSRRVPV